MKKSFLGLVIIAMVGGLAAGLFVHSTNSHSGALQWAGYFNQVTSIFLRLIKMIIAPLVLTTLVSGIGHIEKASTVGRIGTKAMIWFVAASFCALVIGLLTVKETALDAGVGRAQDLAAFFEHLILASIVDALGKNEILQVVVFSLFAGIAISSLGVHAKNVLNLMDEGAAVVLKITTYVMMSSPIAIFAAVAGAISVQGIGILVTYGKLVGDFYLALIVLIGFMIFAASWVLRDRTLGVIRAIWSPALIAFSTSTSEAA
ncbi:MAG: dicarboxylate/amino acid:cation symporter, partial [Alphaproteobacteria bacterium]|nr:dicarboxylate/amino acid:cation symporter [Alphaproteobacteria bacterium]